MEEAGVGDQIVLYSPNSCWGALDANRYECNGKPKRAVGILTVRRLTKTLAILVGSSPIRSFGSRDLRLKRPVYKPSGEELERAGFEIATEAEQRRTTEDARRAEEKRRAEDPRSPLILRFRTGLDDWDKLTLSELQQIAAIFEAVKNRGA